MRAREILRVLIRAANADGGGARPGWNGGLYDFMRRVLATEHGGALYRKRHTRSEPLFAHTRFNRCIDRRGPSRRR